MYLHEGVIFSPVGVRAGNGRSESGCREDRFGGVGSGMTVSGGGDGDSTHGTLSLGKTIPRSHDASNFLRVCDDGPPPMDLCTALSMISFDTRRVVRLADKSIQPSRRILEIHHAALVEKYAETTVAMACKKA